GRRWCRQCRECRRRRVWPLSVLAARDGVGTRLEVRVVLFCSRHGEAGLVGRVGSAVEDRGLIGAALDDPLAGRMVVAVRIAEGDIGRASGRGWVWGAVVG